MAYVLQLAVTTKQANLNNNNYYFYYYTIYSGTVEKKSRSRMNAPLRISSPNGDQELEKTFVEEAAAKNMIQLKGHR